MKKRMQFVVGLFIFVLEEGGKLACSMFKFNVLID